MVAEKLKNYWDSFKDWISNTAKPWILNELKTKWGSILLAIIAIAIVISLIGDIRAFLHKDNTTIVQPSTVPINLNANGTQTASPAPVYVYVGAKDTEQSTASITQKDSKDSPDVTVKDEAPIYHLNYNGKDFLWKSPVQETYKFENGTMTMNRTSSLDVNVEVPQPQWSIGVGKSFNGGVAVKGDIRIGRTPFNVWGYSSSRDNAIGIAFTQYSSGGSKVSKEEPKKVDTTKDSKKK